MDGIHGFRQPNVSSASYMEVGQRTDCSAPVDVGFDRIFVLQESTTLVDHSRLALVSSLLQQLHQFWVEVGCIS